MANNQFVVDLGTVKISDEERQRINAAIQKAVTGELATINLTKKVALFPVNKLPNGPFIYGIVVRDLGTRFDEFIK